MQRSGILRSEKGSAVLFVGIWLILLLFVGFAVDFGSIFFTRRAMQNACDAGALAGAQDLANSPGTATTTATHVTTVNLNATAIVPTNLTSTTLDVTYNPAAPSSSVNVRVDVSANARMWFLRLLNVAPATAAVRIQCTARLVPASSTSGLVPLGLNGQNLSAVLPPGCTVGPPSTLPAPGTTFSGPCATSITLHTSQKKSTIATITNTTCASGQICTLQMIQPSNCGGNSSGFQQWSCVFQGGTPGTYCAASTGNSGCDTVPPFTGLNVAELDCAFFGSCGGGANNFVNGICAINTSGQSFTATSLDPSTGKPWTVLLPVITPSSGGQSGVDTINDFIGFEFNCPTIFANNGNGTNESFTKGETSGGDIVLPGQFVGPIFVGGAGNPGPLGGVDTVILVQ